MKVLDATFLIDYGNEIDSTAEYLLDHSDERFVIPSPTYTEYLLGTVHSDAATDIEQARTELDWADVVGVTEEMAVAAAEIADEIGPEGPELAAIDAIVAGVGRELGAAVVTADTHLIHDETQSVVEVDEYR